MEKKSFTIESNRKTATGTYRLRLRASGGVEPMHGGQFVGVGIDGFYLRRPIAVCDAGEDWVEIVYKVVGKGTAQLSGTPEGASVELLTGLGNGFTLDACKDSAVLLGGGIGAAPLHFLCKELLAAGKKVSVILGFNTADEIVLVDEYRALGVEPIIATMDGSVGVKGFVTDALAKYSPEYGFFYTCGPLKMMQAVCKSLKVSGEASLEERMGCGAGFCYGCTIKTVNGPRRVCKDGPVFRKEDIIW